MAKKQTFGDKVNKGQKKSDAEINFFGTRQDMVVKEVIEGDTVVKIVAQDDQGQYITYPEHIDSSLADPNRFDEYRVLPTEEDLAEAKPAQEKDASEEAKAE